MANELMKSVEETDEFFCRMIDLIHPDNFGFDEDIKNKLREQKHEMVDKKLRKGERIRFKEHGKQLLSRLDFDTCRTVTQIWSMLGDQKPSKSENFNTKNSSGLLPTEAAISDVKKISKKHKMVRLNDSATHSPLQRTDLLVKLHSKVEEMRKRRKAYMYENETVPSRNKRKNDHKTKRIVKKSTPLENGSSMKKIEQNETKPAIKNSSGETVFSKFDFSVFGVKSNEKKSKTNKNLTGKDYKKLLETVEKRDEKLSTLKLENPEKAAELEKKLHWDAATDRAQGIKVKDDKSLLKRSLKNKEKNKKLTEKKWKHRDESMKHKMQKRQDDRNRNIRKRKDENLKKKLDKARKKGRSVPKNV